MKHQVQATSGARPRGNHLMPWIELEARTRADGTQRLLAARDEVFVGRWRELKSGSYMDSPVPIVSVADWQEVLPDLVHEHGDCTLWLARGWADLVALGLTALLDAGHLTWRYFSLDGSRISLTGALRGRPLRITSLSNWTGGRWDAWSEKVAADAAARKVSLWPREISAGCQTYWGSVIGIVEAARALKAGPQRCSAGGQGRGIWTSWLGYRCEIVRRPPKDGKREKGAKKECIVAPIPQRSRASADAERHAAHGLVREQYGRGRSSGKVIVIDMTAAYLVGLLGQRLPVAHLARVASPTLDEARAWCQTECVVACCRIATEELPYLVRQHGRPARAIGQFWAWLTGSELKRGLELGTVREIAFADRWMARTLEKDAILAAAGARGIFYGHNARTEAAAWRSMYAALVGSFAQWRREWVDVDRPHPFGRWASWVETDPKTGEMTPMRAIAGRVQRQTILGEAPHAVPIMYATVTSFVRYVLDSLRRAIGPENVLALACDAAWVTDAGYERYLEMGSVAGKDISRLEVKAEYDRVWLDGRGGAVVEIDGQRYPLCAGVPSWIAAGADGVARWHHGGPWTEGGKPSADAGARLIESTYDCDRFVRRYDFPLEVVSPWIRLDQPCLPENLLLPRKIATT